MKNYYDIWEGYQAIDLIKDSLTLEEYIGFLKGNIIKYHIRKGNKEDFNKDMQKIIHYNNLLKTVINKKL
jgi:hypothetical protein